VQVAYSHDANACAAFARQAAEDWHAFLVHRADELRPGGQLVVLTMAKTDADDFGYRLVIDALIGALMDLAAEGVVSSKEIEKMVIPTYGRTRAEFVAPFDESGQIAGLALASVEIFLGEDHIYEDYERVGDAGAFGRRWAAFVRASTFPTLARALEGGGEERAERFYDLLEARLAARLSAATGPNIIPLAKLLLVKQGSGGHDGLRQTIIATASAANLGRVLRPPHPRQFREGGSGRIRFQTEGTTMRLLALAAGLLIAATIVPVSADAGPVRAAARGTATAVAVTGKTAAKGTVVVGRTAVRGTAAAARTTGRGAVCVATFFRACGRYYP
jgi:hypothetical protein